MIRVLTILGTRPEAIKLAPVLHELRRDSETFESTVVVTGQHREMLDPMLDLFGINPDFDLALMTRQQSLGDITLAVLSGLQPILAEYKPNWVLVQGDTTSVMTACIAAFYGKTRIAHIEAGLRTFDKYSPFPEEINRRIAGILADMHFAPTPWARANLLREGVPAPHICLTGNTVIDAMNHVRGLDFDIRRTSLSGLPPDKRLVLVTAHRTENLGARMEEIATGLRELALTRDDVHFLYPMHMNPRARMSALRHLSDLENVSLIDPLGYPEMVWVLHNAHLVITDSGGLQEEAAGAGTPVLVLRDTTERPEGIEAGIAKLVDPSHRSLVEAAGRLLSDEREYGRMRAIPCPYGDGRAALRITDALADRPASLRAVDHIYERPLPEHPLDVLLREATAGLPRRYADQVLTRARKARDTPQKPDLPAKTHA
jgi:UDP-N-acetylglucosamine 2-epimerase (non-hydrolysing)